MRAFLLDDTTDIERAIEGGEEDADIECVQMHGVVVGADSPEEGRHAQR